MFKSFDKFNAGKLRKELNEVLAKYGADNGIELSMGNIRFTPTNIRTKLEINIKGTGMKAPAMATVASPALIKHLEAMGLPLSIRHITKGDMRVVDYQARAHKYPYILVDRAGKRWKFSYAQLLMYKSLTPRVNA